MTKKTKTKNHEADIVNKNKVTSGTNITYDKAQGNRGKLIAQTKKEKATMKPLPTKTKAKKGK